jgi:beta-ureidopropionase / N-carbamoyl-L-amino-acid hydrolase
VTTHPVHPDVARLVHRLDALAEISPIDGGGNCRLALTDDDKAGRDLVTGWMRDLGLRVDVDRIGNVIGTWEIGDAPPVMTGSHIDTVRTGGRFDGNLGVLAGLEVIEACKQAGHTPDRSLAVGFFTNEEGARFAPDMLGSLVYAGGLGLEAALDIRSIDGARLGDELDRIGYSGPTPCPGPAPHAFVELHIEQGPVLEAEGRTIGAVTGVQGISWQEIEVTGQSNHAGTTPMSHRRDPAYVVGELAVFLRNLAREFGGDQVATMGRVELHPNLINVVPARAIATIDLRNTDEDILRRAEERFAERCTELARAERVTIEARRLARFEPVTFDEHLVELVERSASRREYSVIRLPSGAGHDAQMFARVCPTAMIFVPSRDGISHNAAEFTETEHLEAGLMVLTDLMLELAGPAAQRSTS